MFCPKGGGSLSSFRLERLYIEASVLQTYNLAMLFRSFAVFVLASMAALAQNASKQISSEELEKLLEKKDAIFFLDVREPDEIARLGSVKGYTNIPLGQLESRLREIPKDKLIVTL